MCTFSHGDNQNSQSWDFWHIFWGSVEFLFQDANGMGEIHKHPGVRPGRLHGRWNFENKTLAKKGWLVGLLEQV
jgi:hypothetical protein